VAVATLVAALDLCSKHVVSSHLVEGRLYGLGDRWGLRRVHNVRGGLIALAAPQAAAAWVVMIGCVGLILAMRSSPVGAMPMVGIGLVAGGAAGNVAGRFVHGSVVDFVAAGPWPVFNLGDAALVLGVMLTAWGLA
jgi:signal peptidase II